MKRAVISFAALVSCATLVVAMRTPAEVSNTPSHRGERGTSSATTRVAEGAIARALAVVEPRVALAADTTSSIARAAERQMLRRERAGTYIDEILLERDSSLARWPDRDGKPLAVWIAPSSPVPEFSDDYIRQVRDAFRDWDSLELPVHFVFVDDSSDADVHVTFIDHFNEAISGRTRWSRDDDWTITDANIVLAVHHFDGEQLDGDAMRAMALHEIGHLLGLDHTSDSSSIMAPRVRVRELADEDRATARLLYALPAGPVR